MFCINCGSALDADSRFCPSCGKKKKDRALTEVKPSLNKPNRPSSKPKKVHAHLKSRITTGVVSLVMVAGAAFGAVSIVGAEQFRAFLNSFKEAPPLEYFLLDESSLGNSLVSTGETVFYDEGATILDTEECSAELSAVLAPAIQKKSSEFESPASEDRSESLFQDLRRFESESEAQAAYTKVKQQVVTMACLDVDDPFLQALLSEENSSVINEWSPIANLPIGLEGISWKATYNFTEVEGCILEEGGGASSASMILNGTDLYFTEAFVFDCWQFPYDTESLDKNFAVTNEFWTKANQLLLQQISLDRE